MSLRRRRLTALALTGVLALTGATTAGCAVGMDALTNQARPGGDGAFGSAGTLQLRSFVLVVNDEGEANLAGTIVNVSNDRDDALTSVRVEGGGTATLSQGDGRTTSVLLPARTRVQFGYGENAVLVSGVRAGLGRFVPVTFEFRDSGTATLQVLTVPGTGIYDGLAPTPEPTVQS